MRNDTPTRSEARPPAHRSRWRRLTAAASTLVLGSGLTMVGAAPAQAAPGDESRASAQFLGGSVLSGIDLSSIAGLAGVEAENFGTPEPEISSTDLDVTALSAIQVVVSDGVSVPLGGPVAAGCCQPVRGGPG
ncbi:DUF3693 domain-containing protein [Nesterenkonia sp. Act20]|uniref:DUF3693 domain-containing protein n=1 Tax=Nesterenkonia sp. Act20 TaxID=1483432 RepID=UPI001C47C752